MKKSIMTKTALVISIVTLSLVLMNIAHGAASSSVGHAPGIPLRWGKKFIKLSESEKDTHKAFLNAVKNADKKGAESVLKGHKNLKTFDLFLNAPGDDGLNALHIATANSDFDIAEMLIEFNADIFAQNKDGETALDMAERYYEEDGSHQDIINLLEEVEDDLREIEEEATLDREKSDKAMEDLLNDPSFNKPAKGAKQSVKTKAAKAPKKATAKLKKIDKEALAKKEALQKQKEAIEKQQQERLAIIKEQRLKDKKAAEELLEKTRTDLLAKQEKEATTKDINEVMEFMVGQIELNDIVEQRTKEKERKKERPEGKEEEKPTSLVPTKNKPGGTVWEKYHSLGMARRLRSRILDEIMREAVLESLKEAVLEHAAVDEMVDQITRQTVLETFIEELTALAK